VRDLANLTRTHEDSLYRVLRAVAGFGVFAEGEGQTFRLTPMAEFLRTDARDSLRVRARVAGEEWMWRPWGELMHSVKTGEIAFDHLYGKHTWEWFRENPGPAELFNAFMDVMTLRESRVVVANYDFRSAKTVVDVGGGRGVLLAAALNQNQSAKGILFELPRVIESARQTPDATALRRVDFESGDFFKSVPSGGDVYVLKNILHDWNDADCKRILGVLHGAMGSRARLLVIENLVCGPNRPCQGKMADVQMLVRNGGRNRTGQEYQRLLAASRFRVARTIQGAPDIIEAVRG